jgi:hypothetical protein
MAPWIVRMPNILRRAGGDHREGPAKWETEEEARRRGCKEARTKGLASGAEAPSEVELLTSEPKPACPAGRLRPTKLPKSMWTAWALVGPLLMSMRDHSPLGS